MCIVYRRTAYPAIQYISTIPLLFVSHDQHLYFLGLWDLFAMTNTFQFVIMVIGFDFVGYVLRIFVNK